MDTLSLKEYIFENNKIEFVLEEIGCHSIKYHHLKEYYSCANFDGDNTGAVNVSNNKWLNVINWTRQNKFGDGSDIFDLVQYNKKCSFVESVKYLHKILGLDYTPYKKEKEKEKKFDPLEVFKRALSPKRKIDVADVNTIEESVLDEYIPLLHIDWFRDGITQQARDKFGLAYSYKHKRVIIPHRFWSTGELLGMNMRTTIPNYEELGISKYYLTSGMNKSINLYGLWENYESIQEAKYVIVLESERSVLKNYSRDGHEYAKWEHDFNGKACVALSGKSLSEEQVRILKGLNVEIIIALDNDVDINEVRYACERFYKIRNVSYIYDKQGILGKKDSIADVNNEDFDTLFNARISYDESEHKKYLDSLNK